MTIHTFTTISDPQLATQLIGGAVGVLPTDTLYGLVCLAANEASVARLYGLKHREHKPGTLIAADIDQLVKLGIPRRYLTAVKQFWPGAVSVETPHHIAYLTQATGRQAIRIPDDPQLLALLRQTGPLQTTSANQPDEPAATTVAEAKAYFGDNVDFYADGGDLSGRLPSTIIRVIDDAIEVLREGAVKIDDAD
ncbi:MAG TPA: L-threonylcarbamoyladenylate synthase [Candidatus Saccharimonadales bacterium]|jgi:tRNA threonylcarbamoyl adenosine modification protein (Sua5/YciO/YrdC/YwlC family)